MTIAFQDDTYVSTELCLTTTVVNIIVTVLILSKARPYFIA